MNKLINIFSFLLFLIIMFWLRFPNLYSDNYLYHKLILVILGMTFQAIYKVIDKISKKCVIDIKVIYYEAMNYGIMTLIGYSIYQDLMTMNYTRDFTIGVGYGYQPISCAIVLTLFVSIIEIFRLLTNTQIGDGEKCNKKENKET